MFFFWCIDYCRQNHNFHMCSIMNIVELKQNVTWHIFKSVYCTFIRAPKRGKTITSKTMNQIGSLYFSAACFSRAYLTHWFHTNLSLLLPLPQSLPPLCIFFWYWWQIERSDTQLCLILALKALWLLLLHILAQSSFVYEMREFLYFSDTQHCITTNRDSFTHNNNNTNISTSILYSKLLFAGVNLVSPLFVFLCVCVCYSIGLCDLNDYVGLLECVYVCQWSHLTSTTPDLGPRQCLLWPHLGLYHGLMF